MVVFPSPVELTFISSASYNVPLALALVTHSGSRHQRSIPRSSAILLAALYPGPEGDKSARERAGSADVELVDRSGVLGTLFIGPEVAHLQAADMPPVCTIP